MIKEPEAKFFPGNSRISNDEQQNVDVLDFYILYSIFGNLRFLFFYLS